MYKYPRKQIAASDFGMPLGMELDPNNRWVKKAQTIPWQAIEHRYAALFDNNKGNVAKPLRLALGALIIQTERQISDVEVVLQIQETPCLQYFCGFPGYSEEMPFDPSLMVHFRKRLTSEILQEVNEMIISKAEENISVKGEDDTLVVDASCAPQNIRYPQDLSLLNEAREKLEKMVDKLHKPNEEKKPRTYRKKARKDFLSIAKKRKKSRKQIRKAIGKQIRYIRRDLGIIDSYYAKGRELASKSQEELEVIRILYEQQLQMWLNKVQRVNDRIVSIQQPWIRPIVRGKAKGKCEFGAKIEISVNKGLVRLERSSFDAYNESESLIEIVENYQKRKGRYPQRILADGIYRTRANLSYCNEKGIQLSGPPLGRPRKDGNHDKKQLRQNEIDRIEVERKFSLAKGSFGMGLIRTKLRNTSQSAISLSILALNIAYIERLISCPFRNLIIWLKEEAKEAKKALEKRYFAFVQ
jgi:plasmid stabilization system protein ParE